MRNESNYDFYQVDPYDPYESPPYVPPIDTGGKDSGGGDGEYFGLPYVPPYGVGLDTGLQQGVSRVGPSVSIQPYMSMPVGMPAGSLFSRFFGGGSAYRGRTPYGRGMAADVQEKLRRRRKGNRFL